MLIKVAFSFTSKLHNTWLLARLVQAYVLV